MRENSVTTALIVALAAIATNIAEDAVAALGPFIGELRIRRVGASSNMDTDVGRGAGEGKVAWAADVAGHAVGVAVALRSGCGAGAESHGDGDESGLEDETGHFVVVVVV